MQSTKTFCVLPWMHVATTPGGSYRVCCNSDSKNNKLTLNGSQLKVNQHSYKLLHQSETLQEIRSQMLSGHRPNTCSRCFSQEDAGVRSSRQIYNEVWGEDRMYTLTDEIVPRYVDLRLGNLCNIKCRMCNPYSSNQCIEEWEKINGEFSKSEKDWLINMNWPNFTKSDLHLKEMMHSVEEIYFTGGEPTIIKRHDELLDYCIAQGIASKIKLKYNTNLTNVPVRLINKWKHFKYLRLNCSIDGIGKLNDYIRFPSNWKGVRKNYQRILDQTANRVLDIHTTVQVTNILHLHKFIEYFVRPCNAVNDQIVPVIFFNILDQPDYLNIQILPSELKKQVQQNLKPWLRHPDLESLPGVLEYMWHRDGSSKWDSFIKHTRQLDRLRNQNLLDIVPEFQGWV